ncbi:MAG: DNA repair exonuclease, partial [Solumvirus sp.]
IIKNKTKSLVVILNLESGSITFQDDWKDTKAVFCHQEFKGVKMGIATSAIGDIWDEKYPPVISGHIHDHELLNERILYVGTPAQYTFAESSKKTISLITFDNKRQLLYPSSNKLGFTEQRINLKLPKKITIEIPHDKINEYTPDTEDSIRVIITGTPSQNKIVSKNPRVKEWIRNGVKVHYKDLSDAQFDESITKVIRVDKTSFGKVFQDACDSAGLIGLYKELFGDIKIESTTQSTTQSSNIKLNVVSNDNILGALSRAKENKDTKDDKGDTVGNKGEIEKKTIKINMKNDTTNSNVMSNNSKMSGIKITIKK